MIASKPSLRQRMLIVWNRMTPFQKGLFITCCVLLPIELFGAVYVASVPEMVSLVRSDDLIHLKKIKEYMETNNIKYSLSGTNTILVDKSVRSKVTLQLAGQGLIGPSFGPGFELFDEVRLGMTDNMFDAQKQRALENTLAKAITGGAPNITDAIVRIAIPNATLFKQDQAEPTATVKILTQGSIDVRTIEGIQRLAAASVEKMTPQMVVVVDGTNKILSENSDIKQSIAQKQIHNQYQKKLEADLTHKLEETLHFLVGPEKHPIAVTIVVDWEKRKIKNVHLDNSAAAPVSTKVYEEESTTPGISDQPSVGSNVQDSGLGAEASITKSKITESIINNQYPWSETFSNEKQ